MAESGLTVLLVEDNVAEVELAIHGLRSEGLANEVDVVRDGQEALDYLFCQNAYSSRSMDETPRLILLDLKLPKMHGLQVLRQIKADTRTKTIPVVVFTSSREEGDRAAAYRLGANGYVQKPVDFEDFRAAMRHLGYFWLLVNQPPLAGSLSSPETRPALVGAEPRPQDLRVV